MVKASDTPLADGRGTRSRLPLVGGCDGPVEGGGGDNVGPRVRRDTFGRDRRVSPAPAEISDVTTDSSFLVSCC